MSKTRRSRSRARPAGDSSKPGEPSDSGDSATAGAVNWREHIGAAIALFATAYIGARILTISDYDSETAYGFLRETGALSVGVGAMLTFVPILASIVWAVGFVLTIRNQKRSGRILIWWVPAALALTGLAAAVAPPVHVLACLVVAGFGWLAYDSSRSKSAMSNQLFYGFATVFATFVLVPAVLSRTPWLPTEQIEVAGQPPFTAYVLTEDSDTITVLYEDPRQIARIERSALEGRGICKVEADSFWRFLERPLWAYFRSAPDYPRCPEATAPSQP